MEAHGLSRLYPTLLAGMLWAGIAIMTGCLLLGVLGEIPAFWRQFGYLGGALSFGAILIPRLGGIPILGARRRPIGTSTDPDILIYGFTAAVFFLNFLLGLAVY